MLKLVLGYSLSSFLFGLFGVDWEAVDERIEEEFPDTNFISTEELVLRFESSALPIIIDVRQGWGVIVEDRTFSLGIGYQAIGWGCEVDEEKLKRLIDFVVEDIHIHELGCRTGRKGDEAIRGYIVYIRQGIAGGGGHVHKYILAADGIQADGKDGRTRIFR